MQHAPEKALLDIVAHATNSNLARGNEEARLALSDLSVGLTRAVAADAPKIARLTRTLGRDVVVKLLVVVLRAFVDSVRVPDKMGPSEIIDLADDLVNIYTHDSIKDIVLALKEARLSGTKFYQSLDSSKVCELIITYFDKKATWLENQHLDQRARSAGDTAASLAQLDKVAPKLLENLSLRIPNGHPAQENLRRKLSIINGKRKHGLITIEQAELYASLN